MTEDFMRKYGPTALVTGASSGIGQAFAKELASRGFNLVLVARRHDRMTKLADMLKAQHGTSSRLITADLANPDSITAILSDTVSDDIGLLVSNAGFNIKGPYEDCKASTMANMLMVNCNAPMQLAHGFIPRFRKRGMGGIIFTGSVEGFIGCPYSTAYSASKALVKSLGEGLWAELRPDHIDVLTLCPGATETEATEGLGLQDLQPADDVARIALENITNGPTLIPHPKYKAMFESLLAQPREQVLMNMAQTMRNYAKPES